MQLRPTGSLAAGRSSGRRTLCALVVVGQAGEGGDRRCERQFGCCDGNRQTYRVTQL